MAENKTPNFVPPKKRAGGKRGQGGNGHGDFIMTVQVSQNAAFRSEQVEQIY